MDPGQSCQVIKYLIFMAQCSNLDNFLGKSLMRLRNLPDRPGRGISRWIWDFINRVPLSCKYTWNWGGIWFREPESRVGAARGRVSLNRSPISRVKIVGLSLIETLGGPSWVSPFRWERWFISKTMSPKELVKRSVQDFRSPLNRISTLYRPVWIWRMKYVKDLYREDLDIADWLSHLRLCTAF